MVSKITKRITENKILFCMRYNFKEKYKHKNHFL